MKVQLDFDSKEIRLENGINLGEFISKIKKVLPNHKEWTLISNSVIHWNTFSKIVYPYDTTPFYYDTNTPVYSGLNTGTYNVEMN